jgi:hypothetical protein
MKIGKVILAIAALSLASANVALAGPKTIASAPARAAYPSGATLRCNIANIDPGFPHDVTIETVDYDGTVCNTSSSTNLTPYQATSFVDSDFCAVWCRFTVDTSTKKFRAVATYENATSYTAANVAN